MNNFFNIGRFGHYTAKIYSENRYKYLTFASVVFGTQMLWVIICNVNSPSLLPWQFAVLMFALWIFGVLFVFSEMSHMRARGTASIAVTLPVSVFERYLLLVLNTIIVFPVVFFLSYYIVSLISTGILGFGEMSHFLAPRKGIMGVLLGLPLFAILAIFAGATNMKNHLVAFVIVILAAIPLLGHPVYLPWFINSNILNGVVLNSYFNGLHVTAATGDTTLLYSTVPMFGKFFTVFTGRGYELYIWPLLLLIVGYFKLKERQVK